MAAEAALGTRLTSRWRRCEYFGAMASKVLEKSSVNFPYFVTGYYAPSSSTSRAFQSLVRGIGEAKSKHEEDRIVKKELGILREKLTQRDISVKLMREFLVRLIYCEMLGHDASFGYVEAIKFAQQPNILDKRVGYLAVSLFLHENHELIVLLINTLQKDLRSTNVLEVCCALTVVCKLINKDMMPALLPQVLELLNSKRDIVRKKAVLALQCLHAKNPSAIPNVRELAKKAICDKDPGVMGAALHVYHDLITANPTSYKDLVPAFVTLQKLILEGKLAQDYDYHGVPAPWIQIQLLRLMGLLGADDIKSSQAMYQILAKTLTNLNTNSLISYAVAYECTRTITSIYPDKALVDKAARCVGVFLVAKTNDIKYLGITTLASLIQVDSGFATEPAYQRIVIDCLDNPDETLKRKTLDLLCRITNATNVETICEKLLVYLKSAVDTYFRRDLVDRITELAERYNSWYILTMNEVFELGGGLVRESVAHNLMRLLAEGNDDEESDNELRRFAVMSYMDLLEKPVLPDILVQVISWVLGEYSYTATEYDPQVVLEELFTLLDRKFEDSSTKGWIVTAIGKLTTQTGQLSDGTRAVLDKHVTGVDVELRQRGSEIQELSLNQVLMQTVLPVDGCCEDLEVDVSLSFLDSFVSNALTNGASPYKPPSERNTDSNDKDVKESEPKLKFTPYENPMKKDHGPLSEPKSQTKVGRVKSSEKPKDKESTARHKTHSKIIESPSSNNKLFSGQAVWGPGGYARDREKAGSGDSNSKSDSSSRSSGSDRQVVKTQAETSASPLVAPEDTRKQHLAAQLFKGVTNNTQPSPGRRTLPQRGNNRLSRNAGKTKPNTTGDGIPSVKGRSPSLPHRTTKNTKRSNMDLLLDLGSHDVDGDSILEDHGEGDSLLSAVDTVRTAPLSGTLRDDGVTEDHPFVTEYDPPLNIPSGEDVVDIDAHPISQKTPLLDEEITEQAHSLQLVGAPSASLPDELLDFPQCPEAVELCSDSNLRVTLQKVWKPAELVLVLFLTNQNQAGALIHDVISILEAPSNLIGSFDSSPNNKLQDDCVGSHEWVRHLVVLRYQAPALHMNFGGKISYKDPSKTLKHLFFDHVLKISDILRPLVISTEEFGQTWSAASFEKKEKLSSAVKSCQEFAEKAEECLRLHSVEIIDSKVIAAGTVMQSGICLLHANCTSGMLELSIKSNNRLLNDAVMRQCSAVFT